MINKLLFFSLILLISTQCARQQIYSSEQAMRQTKKPLSIKDDLPLKPLIEGLRQNMEYLKSGSKPEDFLTFGERNITVGDYVAAVNFLIGQFELGGRENFEQALQKNFETFEVYGDKKWGDVFITSYYDPVVEASKKPNSEFSQALYGKPANMVSIDYGEFVKAFPKLATKELIMEQKSRKSILRGRLLEDQGPFPVIVPFYDRQQIDEEGLLKSSSVLAWVRPEDAFFLQIQGSGELVFNKRERLKVGYAAQNGHPYVAIGRFLLDEIPLEKMSMQKIRDHLKSLTPEARQELLNKNPSYVFFQKLESASLTFFGTEVIPGRTIATDYGFFPKGVLGYLRFNKPVLNEQEEVSEWQESSRLILDQDTGGAIRGPGRLDLYWGKGDEAARYAGVMKTRGQLYYFVPKPSFLQEIQFTEPVVSIKMSPSPELTQGETNE